MTYQPELTHDEGTLRRFCEALSPEFDTMMIDNIINHLHNNGFVIREGRLGSLFCSGKTSHLQSVLSDILDDDGQTLLQKALEPTNLCVVSNRYIVTPEESDEDLVVIRADQDIYYHLADVFRDVGLSWDDSVKVIREIRIRFSIGYFRKMYNAKTEEQE